MSTPSDGDTGPCPRCGRHVPRHALSRADNTTYICDECGMDEAVFEYEHRRDGTPLPPVTERLP